MGLGKLFAITGAICFGTTGILTVWFEDAGGEAMTLVFLRFAAAAIVFSAAAALAGHSLPSGRDRLVGLSLGAFQLVYTAALLVGFANAPVSLIALLFSIYPVLVVIGAAAWLGERVGTARLVLIAVAVTGLALAIGAPGTITFTGVALGLLAAFGLSGVILGSRHLFDRGVPVPPVVAMTFTGPALVAGLLVIAGAIPPPPGDSDAVAIALTFMVIGTVVPVALFNLAVRRIGAGLTSLLATLEPVVGIILAFVLLDESFGPLQFLGAAFVFGAVAMLAVAPVAARAGEASAAGEAPAG